MDRISRIEARLRQELAPSRLEIRDDSRKHAGHGEMTGEGQTHLHITVVSERFAGLPKVARHQMVYALLEEELRGGLHAVGIDARAPD